MRFFKCHIRLEIYTIDSVESLISNTDLVSDLKVEMKLKTIEKHHYVIHLIIRSNLTRNSFGTYVNISSKKLKGVLNRSSFLLHFESSKRYRSRFVKMR